MYQLLPWTSPFPTQISVHTWPENSFALVDVVSCAVFDAEAFVSCFREMFKPGHICIRAIDLMANSLRPAGLAIVKQRPGTAKGFVFLSVSDENDIFNVIVTKEFLELNRNTISTAMFISVEGPLQNEDGTIHVRASRIRVMTARGLEVTSHDFD